MSIAVPGSRLTATIEVGRVAGIFISVPHHPCIDYLITLPSENKSEAKIPPKRIKNK
jgi:hypothetical protein